MKYLILSIFILFLLTGCSKESEKVDAKIKRAELTRYEESLITLSSQHALVYDLKLKNEAAKEIVVTIDYYEKGEFVRQISELTDRIVEDENSLRVSILQQVINEEEDWITSILTEAGVSSIAVRQNTAVRDKKNFASTSGGITEGSLFIGEQKTIHSIVYSKLGEMSILHDIETKEDLKKATDYEQVYIVSLEIR
ncbi:hypothetical protein HMPREF1210_02877 [Paenisporosarcina sp. HGH0030]|uniref:hypothetical protein n=1 Tax=Paenisporosarcina sp. HGH0030 TaxID=1078085 RepID=UPI00034E0236|nr:hypothetical protein [Paenisporosarcina sp. HGH0030]EPD50306.1 hypothetical protein HMPREF1210_02877 [Paenisporosarcina sp. HGH0030]